MNGIDENQQLSKAVGLIIIELRTQNLLTKELTKSISGLYGALDNIEQSIIANADSTDSVTKRLEEIGEVLVDIADGLSPLHHIKNELFMMNKNTQDK